jgi:hypothetical protein
VKGEGGARRRRITIVVVALLVGATAVALASTRQLLANAALGALVLVLSWRLFAAVRTGLQAQRAAPLEAPSWGSPRRAIAPLELLRIRAEVTRAHEGREEFGKGLERRLASLAERRAGLAASGRKAAGVPVAAVGGARGKGPSVDELSAMVEEIEEL